MKHNREEQILEEAMGLLTQAGYPAFSMRKVAQRVGVRLSAIQHYFPTRSHLFCAAIETLLNRYSEEMSALMSLDGLRAEDKLRVVTQFMMVTSLDKTYGGFLLTLWGLGSQDKDAKVLLNNFHQIGLTHISELIRAVNPTISQVESLDRGIEITSMIRGAPLLVGPGSEFHDRAAAVTEKIMHDAAEIAASGYRPAIFTTRATHGELASE